MVAARSACVYQIFRSADYSFELFSSSDFIPQLKPVMVWILLLGLVLVTSISIFWARSKESTRIKFEQQDCVLVTGCDSGIGHALANHLALSGIKVIATCLNPNSCEAKKLTSLGVEVLQLDLTADSLDTFGEQVERLLENKRLHALVNNAGVCVMGEFDWLTQQQVDFVFKVNLGSMRIIRLLMDRIISNRSRIINVTSVNGQIAYPGLSVYCASKFALESFSDSLAMELDKFGVRVIKVRPADYARITSIMSAQESHTEQMRRNLTGIKKLRYGDYFEKYQRLTHEMAGQMSMESFDGILEIFVAALFDQNPKISYTAGRQPYVRACQILCIIPEYCQRFVVSYAFRKILRDQDVSLPKAST